MKKYELEIMKTHKKTIRNLFKSIKTACNKRVASTIEVADWQLKVMIPETEPMWIAFDIFLSSIHVTVAVIGIRSGQRMWQKDCIAMAPHNIASFPEGYEPPSNNGNLDGVHPS